jgi:hypothetical protein
LNSRLFVMLNKSPVMKLLLPLFISLLATAAASAADAKKFVPHPATDSFYITNVTTAQDVTRISESLKRVASFNKIEALTTSSGYAEISFDAHANSYAEIAQAIIDAPSTNGKPFAVSMKIRIFDYAKPGNAPKFDAVFAASKSAVNVETINRQTGDFVIHFLSFKVDPTKKGPQGWNWGAFFHPIQDQPPKGLGLKIIRLHEGVPAPTAG